VSSLAISDVCTLDIRGLTPLRRKLGSTITYVESLAINANLFERPTDIGPNLEEMDQQASELSVHNCNIDISAISNAYFLMIVAVERSVEKQSEQMEPALASDEDNQNVRSNKNYNVSKIQLSGCNEDDQAAW